MHDARDLSDTAAALRLYHKRVASDVWFGCYQAYITFAAMLVIVYSLDRLLHTETPLRTLIGKRLRALACAGTGYVLYAVMNRILLSVQHVKLTDYQGVSAIGGFGTSAGSGFAPLSAAKQCLIDFVYFFTGSLRHMNFYSVLNLCMLALLFAGLSAGSPGENFSGCQHVYAVSYCLGCSYRLSAT